MLSDLRFSLRNLRRNPGFALAAILSLALAIGGNTAVFSVVNSVLLNPLPFAESDRLVLVHETLQKQGGLSGVAYPNYLDWRRQASSFEEMAAFASSLYSVSAGDRSDRLAGELVSVSYFPLLGAKPILGRTFLPSEDAPGAEPHSVVISHRLWQTWFGGAPDVLNRKLRVNDATFDVAGVMPAGFKGYTLAADFWVPITAHPQLFPFRQIRFLEQRDIHWHMALGRLKAGVTIEQASAEMRAIGNRLAELDPKANHERTADVMSAKERLVGRSRPALLILLGAVALVLLVACANVAGLFLVRTAERSREFAVRLSMGAPGWRLIRQSLVDSLTLTAIAGAFGMVLAAWGTAALVRILPSDVPALGAFSLDARVLAFAFGITLLTGVAMALAPVGRLLRPDLATALRGARGSAGASAQRMRQLLVAGEVALALVLLVSSAILLRSLWNLYQADVGFDPKQVVAARLFVPAAKYRGDQANQFAARVADTVAALPEMRSAAITASDPFLYSGLQRGFGIEGRSQITAAETDSVYFHDITPDYFRTLSISLKRGRTFDARDTRETMPVAIVSESFAKRFFPDRDAIGQRLRYGAPGTGSPQFAWMTIVGVVGDTRFRNVRQPIGSYSAVYVPFSQNQVVIEFTTVAKAKGDAHQALGALVRTLRQIEPEAPIYNVSTMEDRLIEQGASTRAYVILIGGFAGLALALAAIGIYGVMAYWVTLRRREIGVRMAIGAEPARVAGDVFRQGMTLVAAGTVAGLVACFGLTRLLQTMVFEISTRDSISFAAGAAIVPLIAVAACGIPAWRASRVDPAVALRED